MENSPFSQIKGVSSKAGDWVMLEVDLQKTRLTEFRITTIIYGIGIGILFSRLNLFPKQVLFGSQNDDLINNSLKRVFSEGYTVSSFSDLTGVLRMKS